MDIVLPGPIRQNGYVVRSLDAAITSWIAVGVGPWFLLPASEYEIVHRGEVVAPRIRVAFANSGPLQIELIEQENDVASSYQEFLDSGREGFHHLAWWADDYDAFEQRLAAAAWSVVTTGEAGGITKYCYAELDGATSTLIEVMQLNDATRWLATTVHDAAIEWDGRDPVRALF